VVEEAEQLTRTEKTKSTSKGGDDEEEIGGFEVEGVPIGLLPGEVDHTEGPQLRRGFSNL
jgi:hypothetical protein